jgi:hypothetical protein
MAPSREFETLRPIANISDQEKGIIDSIPNPTIDCPAPQNLIHLSRFRMEPRIMGPHCQTIHLNFLKAHRKIMSGEPDRPVKNRRPSAVKGEAIPG